MKIVSWNVNGIRACAKKGFLDFFKKENADIYCLQETKVHDEDIPEELKQIGSLNNFTTTWFGAEKKGYSGTAIISKIKPITITKGIGIPVFDKEGRTITIEFKNFFLINVYVPNSKRGLERLEEKIEFNKEFIKYCEKLKKIKPIIFCGDLNVAHTEIDIANPKQNERNAGFTIEERDTFSDQLNKGYIDTFRIFNKEGNNYTWWSPMRNCRERNIGWRIDYFIISENLKNKIISSKILPNIMGSDHCPILLEIKE